MTTHRPITPWISILVGVTLSGCDGSGGPSNPGLVGELDQGTFYYLCAGATDAQCDQDALLAGTDELTGAFPTIVQGGTFQLNFQPNEGFEDIDHLFPAPGFSFDDTTVTAEASGVLAMVAVSYSNNAVDLVHFNVAAAADIRVSQTTTKEENVDSFAGGVSFDVSGSDVEISGGANATFSTSTSILLRAVPVDATGSVLAGALPISWSTSDPALFPLPMDADDNNVVEIDATGTGSGEVTVTLGGLSKTVTLTAEAS